MQSAVVQVVIDNVTEGSIVCALAHELFPRLGTLSCTSNRVPGSVSGTGSGTGGRHQFSGTGVALLFFEKLKI